MRIGVIKYDQINDVVQCRCHNCERLFDIDAKKYNPSFLDDHGHYEYLSGECPHCAKNGIQAVTIINTSIPESDFDEIELEGDVLPYYEIDARKQVRDLMFQKRPDLKKQKREDINKKKEKKLKDWKEKKTKQLDERLNRKEPKDRSFKGLTVTDPDPQPIPPGLIPPGVGPF